MSTSILIHPEEVTKKWIDRAKAKGYDVLALHPRGGKRAHETLAEMLETLKTPEFRALLDYAAEIGLKIEYEFHAVGYLLPRELFAAHPEYFRLNDDGERTPDCNLCFSNAEAVGIIKRRAAELAKQLYRSTHRFYFWADDVKSGSCCCEKCRRLSASDKNLFLMNEMIDAIREEIPDAELACLAYQDTITVPEKEKPHDGVFLEYAPIDRDMHVPAEKQDGEAVSNVEKLLSFFGKKGSKVLEYWMDNSMLSKWQKPPKKYIPDREAIAADVRFYKSIGFEVMSSFACFLGDDYEELYGEPDVPGLDI